MTNNEIKNIIHDFFLQVRALFRELEKKRETASIQPNRVQFKKLRSFLRLIALEAMEPGKLKLPDILRKQYRSGGKLRDLGLLERRIEEAMAQNPQIQYDTRNLFTDISTKIKKVKRKLLSQKDFETAEKKLMLHIPEGCTTETLKRFLNEKLAAIRAIIARGEFTDKELHEIRKLLKDILYTLKLYRETLKTELGFPFWTPEEIKKVKQVEKWLGGYNDNRNSLVLLSLRRIRAMSRTEKELLLSLRQQLLLERRKLKKLIVTSLQSINFKKV